MAPQGSKYTHNRGTKFRARRGYCTVTKQLTKASLKLFVKEACVQSREYKVKNINATVKAEYCPQPLLGKQLEYHTVLT